MDLEYCISTTSTSPENSAGSYGERWRKPEHSRQLQYEIMGSYSVAELEAEIDKIVINWRENNPRLVSLLINIWDEMSEGDYVHFRTY